MASRNILGYAIGGAHSTVVSGDLRLVVGCLYRCFTSHKVSCPESTTDLFFFFSRCSIPSSFTGHCLLHVASANNCPPGISWEVVNDDGELAVSKEGSRKEACLERCDTAKYIPTRLIVGG